MDNNKGTSVNKTQFGDLGGTTNGEGEFSITSRKGNGVEGTFSRVHKDVFTWTYKDLNGIPLKLIQ